MPLFDPLDDVGDLPGRRAVADAVALEADLGARLLEQFGGALGPLRQDDLVVGATADERRRAGSGVNVVGVLGGEVAVQPTTQR